MEAHHEHTQAASSPDLDGAAAPNHLHNAEKMETNVYHEGQTSGTENRSLPSQDVEKAEKPPMKPWMDPKSFPDGGAKAWLTVAGASACLFVSFGWINCIGVFQDYYQTHQLRQYSPSEIAWIPSLQVFFMLAGDPLVGKIFDDFGPQYLLAPGAFLHVFGLMMTSLSTEYYQFLLSQAVCSAIGASCVFYPAFTCVCSESIFSVHSLTDSYLGLNVVLP
jgi:hypothetical protein